MGTLSFDDEPDSLDGYSDDAEEGVMNEEVPDQEQDDRPVPGYIPQQGDVLPDDAGEEPAALTEVEEDYGAVMDQVDRRMKVANYYRLILDNDLFGGDESSEARIAQGRIRKYVREELEVLLGMRKTANVASAAQATFVNPFTDDEMTALKELARLAIRKMKGEPQLKPIVAKPVPAGPVLRPVVPPTAASVVPVAKKPVQAPAAKPQQVRPPAPQVQTQQTSKTMAKAPAPPPKQGPGDPRIPEQYRNDPTARVVNGKVFVHARDEDNQLIYVVHPKTKRRIASMKDVTPVARPVGVMPMPMPTFAQMNQQSVIQAESNIGVIGQLAARNPNIAALAGAAALHLSGGPTQQQNPDDALSGDERAF